MNNFWNERYSATEYIYGEEPNVFFAEQLKGLKPGSLILPCEGEGRNAVFAAQLGWDVKAFDLSEAGRVKAMALAERRGVDIDYIIVDATKVSYPENSADVVAFIYNHFPSSIRKGIFQNAVSWLKPGGKIILEGFNTRQLQKATGGPKDIDMLYTEDIIRDCFAGLKIELLESLTVELNEGSYHEGDSDVIRFVGVKE